MRKSHNTGLPQSFHSFAMTAAFSHQSRHPELNIFYHPKRRSRHPELVSGSNQQWCKKSIINKMLNPVQHDGIINLKNPRKQVAFSLVEMLMALLVASLLLAALAPVMTRRMSDSEIKVMSEAANYDKDTVISVFTKDTNFTIPIDANQVRATIVGGGGKGGDAFYGNKEFTSSQSFTVPANVTKLRVFMTGAGGGGASSAPVINTAYGSIPNTSETYDDYLTEGEHTVETFKKSGYGAPAINSRCKDSGVTKWTLVADENVKVPANGVAGSTVKVTACGGGGGGGGGVGGGGGSGGYLKDVSLALKTPIYIKIPGGGGGGHIVYSYNGSKVNGGYYAGGGGGRGAAGTGGLYGGAGNRDCGDTSCANVSPPSGGNGTVGIVLARGGAGGKATTTTYFAGNGGNGTTWGGGGGGGACSSGSTGPIAGGGGGGPTTITTTAGTNEDSIIFQVGGGGGGGGAMFSSGTGASGAGGAGGGYGAGGGGGGNTDKENGVIGAGGIGGSAKSSVIGGGSGGKGANGQFLTSSFGGSGGGGGYGGASGGTASSKVLASGGKINTIFGSSYCNGGDSGINLAVGSYFNYDGYHGSSGALRMYYGGTGKSNVFKCEYHKTANGGGGGGAGQMWIGEIDVTPGQTISFNIGIGGAVQENNGTNGNDGGATSITIGSNTYSVSGGRGGKFEEDNTYISTTGGLGGGIKTSNFNSSARYKNWTNVDYSGGGKNGIQGNTVSNGSGGGNGGVSYKIDGTALNAGNGGGAQSNGINAPSASYGAGGGGGGGGADTTFGTGGRGANGYIYIEWGGSNGGGGTAGEIVKKVVTNFDGDTSKRIMKIRIGRGGGITGSTGDDDPDLFETSSLGTNGDGGETSIGILSGGKTVIHKAKGGKMGNNGNIDAGDHGVEMKIPNDFSDEYKEYVQGNMSIISGQAASDDYGGIGGYLACIFNTKDEDGNAVCAASVKSNDGAKGEAGPMRPGCGGTSILSPLYEGICNVTNPSASAKGNNGTFGGGGGGGAVLNKTGGQGGNGGNGFVILEYKSTRLD